MAEHTAFSWTMKHPESLAFGATTSKYLLIDRLVLNMEVAPDAGASAVAVLQETYEDARDHALTYWMPADEGRGLLLDGGVTVTHVEADINDLASTYWNWNDVDPVLTAILEQVKAGVAL